MFGNVKPARNLSKVLQNHVEAVCHIPNLLKPLKITQKGEIGEKTNVIHDFANFPVGSEKGSRGSIDCFFVN